MYNVFNKKKKKKK